MVRKYIHFVFVLSFALVTLAVGRPAHARIDRVVSGHVGNSYQALGGDANTLYPLQTGLNKLTIQGNVAMSTAKFVSLGSLKATSKIVGKGTNYLHVEITVSSEATHGQTGDGIILQPVSKGTPDKFRWKVYERGLVTAIDGPTSVQLGERHTIVFRGSDMRHARLIAQPHSFSEARLVSRSSTAVVYSILFDKCSGGRVNISSFMLVNEELPPLFQGTLEFAMFRGNQTKQIVLANAECAPPRVRVAPVRGSCAPGYYRPTPTSNCTRRR